MGDTLQRKGCERMRILVVEDDRLLNNTLCYNLSAADYEVAAALTKVLRNVCVKNRNMI